MALKFLQIHREEPTATWVWQADTHKCTKKIHLQIHTPVFNKHLLHLMAGVISTNAYRWYTKPSPDNTCHYIIQMLH